MGLYDRYVLPALLELACSNAEIRKQRERLIPLARGRVLEVGVGTGLNLVHYDPARVERLWALDPSVGVRPRAERRAWASELPVELVQAPAEDLPLEDAAVDTVVVTYTLCSIAEPVVALGEMRRVLAPGGELLFAEHGQAPDAEVQRWQRRLNPVWCRIAGGCHLDRPIPRLLEEAGFELRDVDRQYLPRTPRFVGYEFRGRAVAAAMS